MNLLQDALPIRIDKNFDMSSIPLVLTRILQALDDESASADQLQELILHDPPLSARILKLANSAFYSFQVEVKTISHATSLLGLNLVKSLAIGVSLFDSFSMNMRGAATVLNRLWMHSFAVGMVAREVWTSRGGRREGEVAFLCGLLHDIGKVVFFQQDSAQYRWIFTANKTADGPGISQFELELYEVDHAAIGAVLAKEWGLPPELINVIRYHHTPLESRLPKVAVVSVADAIAKLTGTGYDGDTKLDPALDKIRSGLNLSEEEWNRHLAFTAGRRVALQQFFQASS